MGKIKDLPINERPREKALRYGVKSLSNEELLALLIGSGSKEKSAIDISYELLSNYGGLTSLFNAPYQEFKKIKGMKEVKSIKLAATFELGLRYQMLTLESASTYYDSVSIYNLIKPKFINENREIFILLILNKNRKIIYEEILYKGIEKAVPFSSKDVLGTLLVHKGYYFYLIHNHPNGILEPSFPDIQLTENCMKETRKMGFKMIDHLIVSDKGFYSIFEHKVTIVE